MTDLTRKASGPLAGMRVVDLTTILLGPVATQMLGDLGADVIKVESPGGDAVRGAGPPPVEDGMGAIFLTNNRNKRGIVLDLKDPRGLEAMMRLMESADAFVHNMRPQAIDRLGLDYPAVSARNASIVYCGAWGFRRSGPYGHKPAYDDMIQAVSGLAALQAVDGEPRYVTSVVADKVTGLHVAVAVLAALLHRARTGEGQCIEVPMFETLVAFNMFEHLYGKAYEPPRGSMGYPRALSPGRRPYRTRDGWIGALPYTDRQWAALFEIANRPDLAGGPAVRDPAEPPRAHRRGLCDARRAAPRTHDRRMARSVRRGEHSFDAGQSAGRSGRRSPPRGHRFLADRGPPGPRNPALPRHPRPVLEDTRRHPTRPAEARRARRRDPHRDRLRARGDRRARGGRGDPRRERQATERVSARGSERISAGSTTPTGAGFIATCPG